MFVGIDPGQSGGIAILTAAGAIVAVTKMPATEHDVFAFLCEQLGDLDAHAVLERVWAGPKMGSSASFKFGVGVGALRMALTAARVPFDEPTPQKWQTVMGCRANGKGFGERDDVTAKNITKRRAQALFPSVKINHANADAILLAEFCRRIHGKD